ncbi:MAG: hypothetical protein HC929_06140 [Leptolyngbyaceae cyanobacterium SM2_5_2]|nr:hypothetical protein [Leptolyngbyaceae cyanobacterium SM2_5_2]
MNLPIHVQSHIGADGILHIEGLHQIANQDVTVMLTHKSVAVKIRPLS